MRRISPILPKIFVIITWLCFLLFLTFGDDAYARAGGGRSLGSRGFSSGGSFNRVNPPPRAYQPLQPQMPQRREPIPPQQTPSFGRSLLYGIGGGLIGGAIGSMLFGGRGYAGNQGWGGGGFGFGDVLIIFLIIGAIYFIVKKYREKRQGMQTVGVAGASYDQPYSYHDTTAYGEPVEEKTYDSGMYEHPVTAALRHIKKMDPLFDENRFKELAEDIFFKIQGGWTRRDVTSIQNLLSPEMAKSFQREIDEYIEKGWINRLENIAIRQVEIVDAGQQYGEEYITVKFVASLLDYKVDVKTNNILSGSPIEPVKFHEYWTFRRNIGEKNWVLGGITQENDYYNKEMVQ